MVVAEEVLDGGVAGWDMTVGRPKELAISYILEQVTPGQQAGGNKRVERADFEDPGHFRRSGSSTVESERLY